MFCDFFVFDAALLCFSRLGSDADNDDNDDYDDYDDIVDLCNI